MRRRRRSRVNDLREGAHDHRTHRRHIASVASVRSAGSSVSPNHTTPGRASPPHEGHRGGHGDSGIVEVGPIRRAACAQHLDADGPMQACESCRAGAFVEAVDVLCDERDTRRRVLQAASTSCARYRRAGGNRGPTTVVPFPDQGVIATRTAAAVAQVLRAELPPQSCSAPGTVGTPLAADTRRRSAS